ncbi:hypothetical protein [Plebeiibacterium marinum]|uniref:Uncharacterized protein n=1 Tax=Plebeiibacterium marinum TaxID=2992111 RepID=A0AAE3MH96_9BACT|nr:hypothetical protein [Plebeiobacterium marinum]MCW3807032.1 hypothetical protein [Plebeiobacterium marinum]
MEQKIQSRILIIIWVVLFISCTNRYKGDSDYSGYIGSWEIEIQELPNIERLSFTMNLSEKDSSIIGEIVEEGGDTVDITKIIIEDGFLNTRYNWSGHDVGFKVRISEKNKNLLEGSFMRFFDVTGKRNS